MARGNCPNYYLLRISSGHTGQVHTALVYIASIGNIEQQPDRNGKDSSLARRMHFQSFQCLSASSLQHEAPRARAGDQKVANRNGAASIRPAIDHSPIRDSRSTAPLAPLQRKQQQDRPSRCCICNHCSIQGYDFQKFPHHVLESHALKRLQSSEIGREGAGWRVQGVGLGKQLAALGDRPHNRPLLQGLTRQSKDQPQRYQSSGRCRTSWSVLGKQPR